MELDYRAIGIRIRRFRKERGMTQQVLAEQSRQEPSNISHIERGATKLGLPTIVSIANALGVTVDDLLCDSLENARTAFDREAADILSDCTPWERTVITGTMRALKETCGGESRRAERQIWRRWKGRRAPSLPGEGVAAEREIWYTNGKSAGPPPCRGGRASTFIF